MVRTHNARAHTQRARARTYARKHTVITNCLTVSWLCFSFCHQVLFSDINADIGKITEAELQKLCSPYDVMFAQCDVTNAEQLKGKGFVTFACE